LIGSCLPLAKSIVPAPDQAPANWVKGLSLGAEPTVVLP
jgi:hypothetical protein